MPKKIAVIGAGSWGTAIAALLARKGHAVALWARNKKLAEQIQALRYNPRYLEGVFLPKRVWATSDLKKAISNCDVVVLAVPSFAMRSTVKKTIPYLQSHMLIVSLAKGLEEKTLMRMSEVLESELPPSFRQNIGVLSGPNHAEEISRDIPSATVIAASSSKVAKKLQNLFITPTFRVYTNPDVVGVELAGAVKNIIAIAAGVSDGLGYGDNTKASLITRGLAEMTRLGKALGAQPLTFAGLSGMGDLIVTCSSHYSRNRGVGERVGKGAKLKEILKETSMVAEGVRTSQAVAKLAKKHKVEMPIAESVVAVLYYDKEPRYCVKELMRRGATEELEEILAIGEQS